ncbi:MAG: 4-hydroxy-tetrahydrodipicolinate reductase [Cyclobacteriaceae bacterium]|nr:4-hydroxy-tetrahydrodipicolinate reductase [Cyclobacteriaceae bacterium HetDA_MAG_MS6]
MKIALIGYGKMGKVIEKITLDRGHVISKVIDVTNHHELEQITPDNTDVAIEFTTPATAFDNISKCIDQGVKIVSGTTGWLDRYKEMVDHCEKKNGTFLTATNFSLGVNIFFYLNEWLGKVMSDQPDYQVKMEEIHHTQKLDKPSGTAITLAEGIIANSTKSQWVNEPTTEDGVVPIISKREPNVPGTHTITYSSAIDEIEISHIAHSREGFALGAVKVAEWVQQQTGVLTIRDFLKIAF